MKTMSTPQQITVAAIQCALTDNETANVKTITSWIEKAAAAGAKVILPSELFAGHYFCKVERDEFFMRARPVEGNPLIAHFQQLAEKLRVVIPVSFFEKQGQAYYNSVAIIDTDGRNLGVYRKSHIPDGPGYEEKFYFRPGDTGFKVWNTQAGRIGVGICWDQWYPECARAMTLMGADVLFYPTAIGSEPANPSLDTKDRWQRAMIGHAVCNVIPVVAANRIGTEGEQDFYGHSFIADPAGERVAELRSGEEGFIAHTFDLESLHRQRASWGFFRDRRPELYQVLATADGQLKL
jgi:N-carbamoylputrescine amidase